MKKDNLEKLPRKRKKIGLALGGGGAKGLAHIGVIKALEEAQIPIDFIAGTSMGALVGGWYALDKNIKFLENLFLKIGQQDSFRPEKMLKSGNRALFQNKSILEFLNLGFGRKEFGDCEIFFQAVATNVEDGSEEILKEGRLSQAIEASIATPIIFSPIKIGEKIMMDGGFSNPVPADLARSMGADVILAVDVSSHWVNLPQNLSSAKNMYSAILSSFSAVEYQIAKHILPEADLIVRPAVTHYSFLDFPRAEEIIGAGYQETKKNLNALREKVGWVKLPPKTLGEAIVRFLSAEV